ncbi:glutathione S-transferase family protein [Alginatibacterium sediminis]|uniref:glutathione transferase n=1 Tax=Alginatibacterium sediminis TaxID=2164068 RepID=A0A420E8X2_9ALTE|nr:glutathione S-transferase family protein [Alginatibacterium sediminis]RKF15783.1 glutathione S-transferase family protein [Alginatibacterium sediminis]
MITVHHLNKSRSKRVVWLLEELGEDYAIVHHQRDPKTSLAPASLKAIHPLSKAPIIQDGDITICESGAVLEYILDQTGNPQLRPVSGTKAYYQYLEWMYFAEGSLGLPVIAKLMMSMEEREGSKPMDGYIAKEIALDFGYIESVLAQQAYFAGDQFSAADIMMTVILEMSAGLGLLNDCPKTMEYVTKIQSREAYLKATALG